MLVAVQGCSHGSLTAIYDSVAQYEQVKGVEVQLLLLCGDFQALRSEHDFASLAVPDKFKSLGTFHQYYSGIKQAPLLTIVIGGNHEASNYMWELYHGGWLAPNIYYLGAAGSVIIDGLRVSGAGGIYKDHDYHKGHHEKMPLNNSTLRSIYHIREYDVAKLMQLSIKEHSIFLSHDWPISIAHYGNTKSLLSRKPFFKEEVRTNTLGSPPLLTLLQHLQPEHWFAAHLHVKFAAVFDHTNASASSSRRSQPISVSTEPIAAGPNWNPDEIAIDDDFEETINPDEILIDDEEDFDEDHHQHHHHEHQEVAVNPDEIVIADDDEFDDPPLVLMTENKDRKHLPVEEAKDALKIDESADLVEAVRKEDGPASAQGVIGSEVSPPPKGELSALTSTSTSTSTSGVGFTKFLALDKCGPGKDFIQFLDIPVPGSKPDQPPKMYFDPEWLAITRALHSNLSLDMRQPPLPPQEEIDQLVQDELARLQNEGLLVPSLPPSPPPSSENTSVVPEIPELVWEKGLIEVGRVQKFWPTAPAHGQPGGSAHAWYTNPQTEAFCGMLGIRMMINPAPAT